jgi:hypothetical protein
LQTRYLFQSFISYRLHVAIAKNVERCAKASNEFPLRHIRHWNAWQCGAIDERAAGGINEDAMAVDVPGAQFGDFADAAGNWTKMAGAARIGVIKRPKSLREGFMLVELHGIGNVICLRRNETVGLIVERCERFRGARWKIRPVWEVLRKSKSRRTDADKEYWQNAPDSHHLFHFWAEYWTLLGAKTLSLRKSAGYCSLGQF